MEMSEVAKNDITGDEIKTKVNNNQPRFDKNYDQIDWSVKLVPEAPKKKGDNK